MRLDGLPYQLMQRIAQFLRHAFYITTLGSACSAWRNVVRLNQRVLSNGAGSREGLEGRDFARILSRFPCAHTLRLCGKGLDLSALAAAPEATALRALSIAFSSFAPETLVAMRQLTSLELTANKLGSVGIAAIAVAISEMATPAAPLWPLGPLGSLGPPGPPGPNGPNGPNGRGLVKLAIRNDVIGPGAMAPLARALAGLGVLAHLDLSGNYMYAAAATALAPALISLTSLTDLRLAENYVGPEGAAALAPSICALTRLVALDLRRNGLVDAGATALAPSLCALTALTTLELDGNAIGAAGFIVLAPVAQKLGRSGRLLS